MNKNELLTNFDPNTLKTAITDQVSMMMAANLDRWVVPRSPSYQCECNVNSARGTALRIAQRVLISIGSATKPHRLRDLNELLLLASQDAEFVLVDGDIEQTMSVGKNPSFNTAVAACADRIMSHLVLETT